MNSKPAEMMQPFNFEIVSRLDAKRIHEGIPRASAADADWTYRRKQTNNDEPLAPVAVSWVDHLPSDVRPHRLAQRYARIANKISTLWNEPQRCSRYLADLLIVNRTTPRQGFPADVAKDIGRVAVYYAALHPEIECIWNSVQ